MNQTLIKKSFLFKSRKNKVALVIEIKSRFKIVELEEMSKCQKHFKQKMKFKKTMMETKIRMHKANLKVHIMKNLNQ